MALVIDQYNNSVASSEGISWLPKSSFPQYNFSVLRKVGHGFLSPSKHLSEVGCYKMVNAIKGLFISCDIPMAQFIVSYNASLPASQKFIVHMLDSTHMFVQPHVAEMIRSRIADFREQNSYEKPA